MSSGLPGAIASLALSTFQKLPQRCKPRVNADGSREWTPLSAIIISLSEISTLSLRCIAIAAGTKCLPTSALARCNGLVLHDCHAEILVMRGFNYFVLTELRRMLSDKSYRSPYLEYTPCPSETSSSLFRFHPSVSIYMFSTTAPCGDASMELLMGSKAPEEVTPWPIQQLTERWRETSGQPLGRGYFSILGAMRRKPARADAEATLSKSCTDKIMLKQFMSLLAFPADLLVAKSREAHLAGLVVYGAEYSREGYERAFTSNGRLLKSEANGTGVHFDVLVLPDAFPAFEFRKATGCKTTNLSFLWVAGCENEAGICETLINGVKQGYKQFDDNPKKGSVVCRRKMLELGIEISQLIGKRELIDTTGAPRIDGPMLLYCYGKSKAVAARLQMKELKDQIVSDLGGWTSRTSEDDFALPQEPSSQIELS